jgi:uncharacterized protein DUF3617
MEHVNPMKLRTFIVSMVMAIVVLPVFAADIPMKPGKWRSTVIMKMSGVPDASSDSAEPTIKDECLTKEDIDEIRVYRELIEDDDCEVTEYELKSDRLTWAMKCKDGMSGRGKMEFAARTYKAETEVKTDEMVITARITGKYLGSCDEE